jgi:hypothetical protein
MGCLVRIFSLTTVKALSCAEELRACGEMFPPVFVGLPVSVRTGRWKYIGSMPAGNFLFPLFRATSATKPGTYENWWIWDGEKDRFVGKLPKKLRSLEHKVVWGDELLEERIESGRNPFEEIQ